MPALGSADRRTADLRPLGEFGLLEAGVLACNAQPLGERQDGNGSNSRINGHVTNVRHLPRHFAMV